MFLTCSTSYGLVSGLEIYEMYIFMYVCMYVIMRGRLCRLRSGRLEYLWPVLGAFTKLQNATTNFIMSIRQSFCTEQLDEFSWNLIFEYFFENLSKFKFHENLTRITGTLHEYLCKFMMITRWIFLRMRNVLDKCCRENRNTRFMCNNSPPRKSCLYEIMWKKAVEPARRQMKI